MSDVFISYARSTATQAQRIAEAVRALGYSVWRDDELPSHRAYSDVIEEQLQSAKAVARLRERRYAPHAVQFSSDQVRALLTNRAIIIQIEIVTLVGICAGDSRRHVL